MKANKIKVSLITLVLTLALMFSLFSVSVFAETPDASGSDAEISSESEPTEESTPAGDETSKETGKETSAATGSSTTGSTSGSNSDDKTDRIETIISICIIGVTLIIIAIYCIIKREKVAKFLRGLKSEMKKIVWFPWSQVRKSSIVVIVVVVIIAIVIALLDLAFSNGIEEIYNIFH